MKIVEGVAWVLMPGKEMMEVEAWFIVKDCNEEDQANGRLGCV